MASTILPMPTGQTKQPNPSTGTTSAVSDVFIDDGLFLRTSNILNHIMQMLSDYLAHIYFKKDTSRVIYAGNEFAFRKRIEADKSKTNKTISSLDLPFLNFYLKDIVLDEAKYTRNTDVHDVILDGHRVRLCNILLTFEHSLFFHRTSEVYRAHFLYTYDKATNTRLYFDFPLYDKGGVKTDVTVPVLYDSELTLEKYSQDEWLNNNKITALTGDITLHTMYITSPEELVPVDKIIFNLNKVNNEVLKAPHELASRTV